MMHKGSSCLLLGAPGVGKSTFSYHLKLRIGKIQQFSVRLTTEKLREGNSKLGEQIRRFQADNHGDFLPDWIAVAIFRSFLTRCSEEDFLLVEGFPINEIQMTGMLQQLSEFKRQVDGVLILTDSTDNIRKRIKQRRICVSCEKQNGAGLPIPPGAVVCPYCGGKLARRSEDEESVFLKRLRLFQIHEKFVKNCFPPERVLILNVEQMTNEELVEAFLCWLDAGE